MSPFWRSAGEDIQPGPGSAPAAAARSASAGPERRISGAVANPRSESDIRINFRDPQKIIAASNDVVGSGSQAVFYSTDGGASFAAPVAVARTFASFEIPVPAFNDRKALIYATAGAYRTALKNDVYAAWTDLSGAAGCTSSGNAPGANAASTWLGCCLGHQVRALAPDGRPSQEGGSAASASASIRQRTGRRRATTPSSRSGGLRRPCDRSA